MTPSFDGHVHLWQRPIGGLPVGTLRGGGRDQLNMMLTLMDRYGIDRACVVAACIGDDLDNHEFVAEVRREQADRLIMFSEVLLSVANRDELLDRTINDWPEHATSRARKQAV